MRIDRDCETGYFAIMDVQEDVVDTFLRYGLFVGAIFQLICIGAVIIMPDNKAECCAVSRIAIDSGISSLR